MSKVKASWDVKCTKIFIDLCIEQVEKGTRKCTSFEKKGWKEISERFTAMTGRLYDKGQFKNKYDALRKEWQLWDRLLNETGVGWDEEKKTIVADDEWWEKKLAEVPGYDKFRNNGLQFQEELTRLFSSVAATGTNHWAPSSMSLPHTTETTPDVQMQEGSGDSDEVLGTATGLSGEFNSVNFNTTSGGSGGNNDRSQGTSGVRARNNDRSQGTSGVRARNDDRGKGPSSGAERTSSGGRTTSSLGVRKRGAPMKKKGPASSKIADALCRIADATDIDVELAERMEAEARAARMAEEARAHEFSISGVMSHLNQVTEITNDDEFHMRCAHLLMRDPAAREMYVAMKENTYKLIMFLRHECYGHF